MFRALVWKHLRQVRGLVLLGLATVPGVGLVLRLAVPDFWEQTAGGLCGLVIGTWAAMTVVEAFTADRTAGTEDFLHERAVPLRLTWVARCAAAAAALAVVCAGALAATWLMTHAHSSDAERVLLLASFAASIFGAALLACAIGASGFVGVFVSLIFGVASMAFADLLRPVFPLVFPAYLAGWGAVVTAGFAAVAFAMRGVGEPAGRGAMRRGWLTLSVVALLATGGVAAANSALLWTFPADARAVGIRVPSSGPNVLADFGTVGWIVDVSAARALRPVSNVDRAAWRADGERLAISGGAGATRVSVLDADGRATAPLPEIEGEVIELIRWAGDHLLVVTYFEDSSAIRSIVPGRDPTWRKIAVAADLVFPVDIRSAGPDVALVTGISSGGESRSGVHRLDLRRAVVEPLDVGPVSVQSLEHGLSPDATWWLAEKDGRLVLKHLGTREEVLLAAGGASGGCWLAGDRAAWIEGGSVVVGGPGRAGEVIEGPAPCTDIDPSPDGERLLVTISGDPAPRFAVWNPTTDAWTDLPADPIGGWAGPRTLYASRPDGLWFIDADHPANARRVTRD